MNNLQKLLKLRDIPVSKLAEDICRGYHSVQKVVKGHQSTPAIREAIADYLGLSYGQVWGASSQRSLQKQIEKEIDRCAAVEKHRLKSRYLRSVNNKITSDLKVSNV